MRWVLGLCCAGCEVHTFCSHLFVHIVLRTISADPAQCHAQCNVFLRIMPQTTQVQHTRLLKEFMWCGSAVFFWVGARSKIHSALVLCICVDNGSATAERRRCSGSFSLRLVARCLLNILSAMRLGETLSVVYAASPSG